MENSARYNDYSTDYQMVDNQLIASLVDRNETLTVINAALIERNHALEQTNAELVAQKKALLEKTQSWRKKICNLMVSRLKIPETALNLHQVTVIKSLSLKVVGNGLVKSLVPNQGTLVLI